MSFDFWATSWDGEVLRVSAKCAEHSELVPWVRHETGLGRNVDVMKRHFEGVDRDGRATSFRDELMTTPENPVGPERARELIRRCSLALTGKAEASYRQEPLTDQQVEAGTMRADDGEPF